MINIARHFAHPHGLLGRFVGLGMARGNAAFSRWVVDELPAPANADPRIVEIGPGPGVGLEAVLQRFPQASVWGVDMSREMISQSRGRNRPAADAGRLTLILGGVDRLAGIAPIDVMFANHVLYFWHDPKTDLKGIRSSLRPGGVLGVGYQLKQNMPPMAQKFFPRDGHLLYDSIDQVEDLLHTSGFASVTHRVMGPPDTPTGRLALAIA